MSTVETLRTGSGTVVDLAGPADAPGLVLIHGLGLHRRMWDPYVAALSDRYRVVSYDLFGHGDSPPPPSGPDLRLFASQVVEVMDAVEIPTAAQVGFSLGGMINRRLALDHPQRVSSLVILNSPHDRGADQQELVEQRARDSAAGGPGATLDATIERWFTRSFIDANPSVIEDIRSWVLANDTDVYAACRWVLANGVVELIDPDPPVDHRTLVVTCENDTGSTPAMSHAIAADIADSSVVIVPTLQHMGLVEQPAAFLELITGFVASVDSTHPGERFP